MEDPPNVQEAINMLVQCINAKKKSDKHYISYDFARHLAVQEFNMNIRRTNPEAGLIDGVYAVLRRDCPELFKKEAQASAQAQAPVQEAQPVIDEANLLKRFKKMQQLSELKEKLKKGNPYKSITDEAWRKTLNENKQRLEDDLDELGGPLTQEEQDYVLSIPSRQMKSFKLQVSKEGKGRKKLCPKCGLPK